MSNPVLIIKHLRAGFPEVVAVNDLSLNIEAGDDPLGRIELRRFPTPARRCRRKDSTAFCSCHPGAQVGVSPASGPM